MARKEASVLRFKQPDNINGMNGISNVESDEELELRFPMHFHH